MRAASASAARAITTLSGARGDAWRCRRRGSCAGWPAAARSQADRRPASPGWFPLTGDIVGHYLCPPVSSQVRGPRDDVGADARDHVDGARGTAVPRRSPGGTASVRPQAAVRLQRLLLVRSRRPAWRVRRSAIDLVQRLLRLLRDRRFPRRVAATVRVPAGLERRAAARPARDRADGRGGLEPLLELPLRRQPAPGEALRRGDRQRARPGRPPDRRRQSRCGTRRP